jgi:hypothetical protein
MPIEAGARHLAASLAAKVAAFDAGLAVIQITIAPCKVVCYGLRIGPRQAPLHEKLKPRRSRRALRDFWRRWQGGGYKSYRRPFRRFCSVRLSLWRRFVEAVEPTHQAPPIAAGFTM